MPFQGVIWLLDSYPLYPPCVYVNPTRDMIIKQPHSNASPSGLVSLSYLQNWNHPSSNLIELAAHLSAAFSREPPLYSQRRLPPSPSPSIGSGCSRPVQQRTDDAAEVYKKNAISKMVEMVQGDLVLMRSGREAEAEGLLKKREEEINRGLKEMVEEKETLEQQLQVIAMNTDVLDSWIREKKGKAKNLDVDDAFDCIETLSKQMLECTALDLRNVRLLSREQFFHRATAEKVRAVQMDAQVASIAATLHS